MTYITINKDITMDMMTDLTLQDFNPLSKHVKYAQMPDEPPASTMRSGQSQTVDYHSTIAFTPNNVWWENNIWNFFVL